MTNEETLLDLLTTHGAALRRIARVYGAADGEEDDLHQEIVLQLWRGLPSYRGEAAAGTWLYRVALNTALTWRRRATQRARIHAEHAGPARSSALSPRSEAAILEEFLAACNAVDRATLLLYMEGLPYQEIADVLGLSSGAVGVRVHRIRRAFVERYVER